MTTRDVSVLVDGLAFGEGPRWHDGALFLSDMHSHRVLSVDPRSDATTVVAEHDSPLSGIGWLPDGRLLVVAMDGAVLRLESSGLVVHADVTALAPHGINDMIVHPQGWAWVGQFGYDRHAGATPAPSPLIRVDPDGTASVAADDMMVANGMAITPDGRTLIVAESAGRKLTTFVIGSHGVLTDRSMFAELPHAPDGMCLDAEGAVWAACVTASRYARVLAGGEIVDTIELEPPRRAVACVLGGAGRRTLYMLTADTLGEADLSRELMSARVEQVQVDVPGAGLP
ncbi:MAG: SMP-30/gluconolactonase/LRE family protein [Acidimicrobiia bacterium]